MVICFPIPNWKERLCKNEQTISTLFQNFACPFSEKRHEKICFKLQAKTRLYCYICGKGFVNVQKRVKYEVSCVNVGACALQDVKKFQCEKCLQTFVSKQKNEQHCCKVKRNISKESVTSNQCKVCLKSFSSVFNRKRHEQVYSKTKGEDKIKVSSATETPDGVVAVNTKKRKRSDEEILPKKKKCQCRQCDGIFEGRHELHMHQNTQHAGALQNRPWHQEAHLDKPPWGDPVRDDPLRQIYEGNQNVMLADAKIDKGRKVIYNLPTNNLTDGVDEIWWKLDEIFTDQNGAFKINLSLGLILRNMETGEYRYFAPHVNDSLFPSLFLIGSRKYLSIFQNKIRRLHPLEHVNNLRPNSKWRPFMIMNVRFDVTTTNFPVGKGVLPDYVKQKRSIVSMEVDSHNRPYKDDHCFFAVWLIIKIEFRERKPVVDVGRIFG